MKWERVDGYCIKSGEYRIAKIRIRNNVRYECWFGRQNIGTRYEPDTARELCESHTEDHP